LPWNPAPTMPTLIGRPSSWRRRSAVSTMIIARAR
jgi:hypothetical protein